MTPSPQWRHAFAKDLLVALGTARAPERVRIQQREADLLVRAHERFVKRQPGGRRLVLRFGVMDGVDLSGRDLADADLTGCTLTNCKFDRSRFSRACLFGADLQASSFIGASFVQADLRGARFKGANLSHANLTQADLRAGRIAISDEDTKFAVIRHKVSAGQLDGANVSGAVLDRSRLDDVSAAAADFSECSMRGAKLVGANLKNASLRGAVIDNVDVSGANFEAADFTNAVVTRVDLAKARILGSIMDGCLCDPSAAANARSAILLTKLATHREWVTSGGKAGEPAVLDGEDLRPLGGLAGAFLTAVSARNACLAGMDLGRISLQGALLDGADLRGVNLREADLRGANLSGANLGQADLRRSLLSSLPFKIDREKPTALAHAKLRYADLREADLVGTDLSEVDLHRAKRSAEVPAPADEPEDDGAFVID
jgi:uncharacterized protein YjbI with pentapeptide repeats